MKFKMQWQTCFLFLLTVWLCIYPVSGFATISATNLETKVSTQLTNAQQLEHQGRSLYQAGKFTDAINIFRQATESYKAQGNSLQQAISLSNLSLSYQQVGLWSEATQAIADSLFLLQAVDGNSQAKLSALAQALSIQGSLQLAQGQAEQALATWERSTALYDQLGDSDRAAENRVNQAQALQMLGLYRRAITTLSGVLRFNPQTLTVDDLSKQLNQLPPSPAIVAALQSLGEALRVTGALDSSRMVLQHSLKLAESLHLSEARAVAAFKLGNVARAQAMATLNLNYLSLGEAVKLINQHQQGRSFKGTEIALSFDQQIKQAIAYYQQAITTVASDSTRIQAQLNYFSLLVETQAGVETATLLANLRQQIDRLSPGRISIDARLNLAQSLLTQQTRDEKSDSKPSEVLFQDIAQLLSVAVQQAKTLNYQRAESYALGTLGRLYERSRQWGKAQDLTQRALFLAQSMQASDIAYLWQWQLGRLLKAQGDVSGAIAAYREAVNTLKVVRKDLVAIALDEQFSFRDTVEPIHRELVDLLLQAEAIAPKSANLKLARDIIESLQLTELINFFREDCLTVQPEQIDQVDPTSAIFYPIILPDRLAVIVSIPKQPLTYFVTPIKEQVTQQRIEQLSTQLRSSLKQGNIPESQYLPSAQQLYKWLIEPIKAELAAKQIKTLVFVLDGVLRNIPMAVLHDPSQNQYLIEQFSVAVTPGLQLLGTKSVTRENFRVLGAGLTESRSTFSDLPNVEDELKQIVSQFSNSKVLLNQQFTNRAVQTDVRADSFAIVHLATHGRFSSQLENTFVLTWDNRLDINQLRELLQAASPNQKAAVELLILSACETAAGDNRAALGLAGVAVRAGARSTLATLWQVNDASSAQLMNQFYEHLTRSKVSKAEALRRAQMSLLTDPLHPKYRRPYYWSPYVLIGNWQ